MMFLFSKVAEWRGFEPPRPCEPNDLANRPLQPLEYHSSIGELWHLPKPQLV